MRGNAQSVFLQLGGDRLAVVKAQDPGGELGRSQELEVWRFSGKTF